MANPLRRKRYYLMLLLGVAIGLASGIAYAAGGDIDPTFNTTGRVTTDYYGKEDEARAIAIQRDGKIVVAGHTHVNGDNWDFAVARYNPDGTPDPTFDQEGRVNTGYVVGTGFTFDDGAYGVALQDDGKIVAVGTVQGIKGDNSPDSHHFIFGVARYNPNGSLDNTFAGDGKTLIYFNDTGLEESVARSAAIQRDGKIVVAGYTTQGSVTNFALTRLNPNGSLDNTFDGNGLLTTDFAGGKDEARAVAIQPDGKIVVAGTTGTGSNIDFALARYNPDGKLDRGFAQNGKLTADYFGGDDGFNALVLQTDGKIVAAGYSHVNDQANYNFALARVLPNGSLDNSFDLDGKQTIDLGDIDKANAVAIQPDGKILLAGFAPVGGVNRFALVRFNPNGSVDFSFGKNGIVTTAFGGGVAIANSLVLQPNGGIVAAGSAFMGTASFDVAVARYLPADARPPTPPPPPTATLEPVPTPTPTISPTDSRFFPETEHTVRGLFLNYWNTHGALAQQGFPITEEVQEKSDTDGKVYTMQYFERAVFEHHPENQPPFNVLLSLLGTFYYDQKYGGNAPNQQASTDNPLIFAETGKTLGGAFRKYWETHGGLAQQGFPISDEFQEVSDTDGRTYIVQYFQRAVFEFHPEFAGTKDEVLLSLLGVFYDKIKHNRNP